MLMASITTIIIFCVGSLVQTAVKNGHEVSVKVLLTKDEYSAQEVKLGLALEVV